MIKEILEREEIINKRIEEIREAVNEDSRSLDEKLQVKRSNTILMNKEMIKNMKSSTN